MTKDRIGATIKLFDDFVTFARWQIQVGDIDPVYPVLKELYRGQEEEQSLFETLVYVAYCNVPSARLALLHVNEGRLPTGIERRGLRTPRNMQRHLDSLAQCYHKYNSVGDWLRQGFTEDPFHNWKRVQETLLEPVYNGRWAAYKTAEILMKSHDFPLIPTDMGMAHSSGPRGGLALFFERVPGDGAEAVARLDEQALQLQHWVDQAGIFVPIEILETLLCDFHSLVDGRYYVGHDIDQMQDEMNVATARWGENVTTLDAIWKARAVALPEWGRGEVGGWNGTRKDLKSLYKRQGILEWWTLPEYRGAEALMTKRVAR